VTAIDHEPERRSSDPTGPPTTLVIASLLVAVVGIGGSALLATWWPPDDVSNDFAWPLFLFGAGPSLVAAAVLFAAATIVDELRKSRYLLTLSLTHASE
jgi:hypothetical protein